MVVRVDPIHFPHAGSGKPSMIIQRKKENAAGRAPCRIDIKGRRAPLPRPFIAANFEASDFTTKA